MLKLQKWLYCINGNGHKGLQYILFDIRVSIALIPRIDVMIVIAIIAVMVTVAEIVMMSVMSVTIIFLETTATYMILFYLS